MCSTKQQNLLQYHYRKVMTTVGDIQNPQTHAALVQVLEVPNGICSGLEQSYNAGRIRCIQEYNSDV